MRTFDPLENPRAEARGWNRNITPCFHTVFRATPCGISYMGSAKLHSVWPRL